MQFHLVYILYSTGDVQGMVELITMTSTPFFFVRYLHGGVCAFLDVLVIII